MYQVILLAAGNSSRSGLNYNKVLYTLEDKPLIYKTSLNFINDDRCNKIFLVCKENEIDTFFIFGGTNDSWLGVPLGEIMYGEKTEQDLYSLFPAFCHLIEKIKENCKNARIITIVNTDLKPEISNMMNEVSNHYNTEVINLSGIAKQSGHPNVKGMNQIYNQIIEKL